MGDVEYGKYGKDIRDRSFRFACRIVEYCRRLDQEGGIGRILAAQIVRSGTSIGANLEEARGGESRRDFISKCAISLKEAREVRFRLRIMVATRLGPVLQAQALADEADELAAILGQLLGTQEEARPDVLVRFR